MVEPPRRYEYRSARAAVVPRLLRGEPQLGLCGDRVLDAVGATGRARSRRRRPPVERKRERVRAASGHASEAERGHGSLVRGTFGSASSNALAASLTVFVSFLLWGIGIGQIYQDVYARAWQDQGRIAGRPGAVRDLLLRPHQRPRSSPDRRHAAARRGLARARARLAHRLDGVLALGAPLPAAPEDRPPRLLPGALLASIVIGGTAATSPFFLAAPLNANGKTFGSFGVVITFVGAVFVLITMSLVCAVFSPVWAHWRETEKQRRDTR